MKTFWHNLPRPFFVLAPMADVTDAAFRQIVAQKSSHGLPGGGPDVFYTEFVSADGLCHEKGREKLILDLRFTKKESPIVAQLFSAHPDKMKEAAKIVKDLGFDGLDINMGCPDKNVEKQGAGAALIKNPGLAKELIFAASEGFGGPIAVKTRLGYSKMDGWQEWISNICSAKPIAITAHLRTRKEMSLVPAHWELAKEFSEIVKSNGILAVANGDIKSKQHGLELATQNNLDGVMLGRAIFGNPWLFVGKEKEEIDTTERLKTLVQHTKLFEELYLGVKSFAVMKKFFKAYISGITNAKELQEKLMACENSADVKNVIDAYF